MKNNACVRLTQKTAKALIQRELNLSASRLKTERAEGGVYIYKMTLGRFEITFENDWFERNGLYVLEISSGTGEAMRLYYWTCTPFSTERNGYKSFVRHVNTSGALLSNSACCGYWGVRPLCALKSDILVSYDEGEVNERKPSFGEMIGKALAEGLNKAILGEDEEPKGILAEAEAQAAREKEQEDEDQKRADAVDMMKHIAAAFDIPATIGEGKQEEQEKEAKQLFGWYSELKKAGFTDAQAFELIKG